MTTHTAIASLPFIDISRIHSEGEDRTRFVSELRSKLHDYGFFYLTGHGVSQKLIDDVIAVSKKFFALPLEEKLKIEMVKKPNFRGYSRTGQEYTRGEKDWREQLDINTEDPAIDDVPDDQPWLHLHGPNQWPDEALPQLKPLLLAYQAEVTRVGIDVLKAIAVALGQSEDIFARIYEPSPSQLLKIIHYPGRDATGSDQGVGAHKDGGFVTVLLQDTVPGLRVRTEDGEWIEAPPVPGSFVINTGELLELATNGFVRADVHDVIAPPANIDRYSVAFFLGARYDATIPVIELPAELRRKERGITADPLNPIFREVGINHLKSRLRSHPDVAQVHHAALVEKLLGKTGRESVTG